MNDAAGRDADGFLTLLQWGGSVIAALWLVMSFTYPFGWDQGLFAWVGDAIVRGGLPYRDAWDIKGPLLYYAYAVAQWIFGQHLWSIRAVDAAFVALAVVAVFRTTAALADQRAARFAALLFVLWYASHSYWHTAQPDGWAGMLLIGSLGPMLAGSAPIGGALNMARAGAYLGFAALLKPFWAVFLALPILHLGLSKRAGWGSSLIALLSGWTLPVLLAIGWFAWHGALDDLVDVHLKYSVLYAGLASDNRLKSLVEYFLSNRVTTIALPVCAYGIVVLWKDRRHAAILLLGWLATTVLLVSLQGRFYAYHWLPSLPAMTLLVAVGVHDLWFRARPFAQILCAIILLSCLAPISLESARFIAWSTGVIDRRGYYDAYGEPGADMRAVEWLRTSGEPGKIFTFGWHCSVPWLSGRESVSRFCYSLPLMMGSGTEIQSRYRAEVLAALNADRPTYIVIGQLSEQILGMRLTVADFPELAELVQTKYHQVAQFSTITIHEISH
ncbi:MAG: hypothetical protein ACRD2N_25210 [Vicinamibacterales bacterium]